MNRASVRSTTSDPRATNDDATATIDVRSLTAPSASDSTTPSGGTPPIGELPRTGASGAQYLIRLAFLLVMAGFCLVIAASRRATARLR